MIIDVGNALNFKIIQEKSSSNFSIVDFPKALKSRKSIDHGRFNWRKFVYLAVHPFGRLRRSPFDPSTLRQAQGGAGSGQRRLKALLQIALAPILWEQLKQILVISSQLFPNESATDIFFYTLDIIENTVLERNLNITSKL